MTRRLQGNSYGLAYGILWSTGFPVTYLLLEAWDPYTLAAARIGLAGLLLALAAYLVGQRYLWRTWPWRRAVLIGGIGVGISTVMLTLGVKYSNPVNAAAIPEYEFKSEITTGMSAPPIGITSNIPRSADNPSII